MYHDSAENYLIMEIEMRFNNNYQTSSKKNIWWREIGNIYFKIRKSEYQSLFGKYKHF